MSERIIRVGNSRAVIIPAKVLHELGFTDDTRLEMSYGKDEIRFRKAVSPVESLVFPQVDIPAELPSDLAELTGCVSFTDEEIEQDERLAYILSR